MIKMPYYRLACVDVEATLFRLEWDSLIVQNYWYLILRFSQLRNKLCRTFLIKDHLGQHASCLLNTWIVLIWRVPVYIFSWIFYCWYLRGYVRILVLCYWEWGNESKFSIWNLCIQKNLVRRFLAHPECDFSHLTYNLISTMRACFLVYTIQQWSEN